MTAPKTAVRPTDPLVIIAGIRQFGLAPDGSDLRDLESALRAAPARCDVQNVDALCISEADNMLLRSAMKEACDLLMERTHGNPARSASHNARLRLERALALPSANRGCNHVWWQTDPASRVCTCERCGASDYGDNDLPLPLSSTHHRSEDS
jgi:hypothetical protein